jgi:hypothetical protein
MEIPTQSVNVTELDFDQIKANLIEYFKAGDSPFKDWDYAGSGLNMLIDVLSHNTHYNALLAHMAVNESFIDTAQLRQNVVSAAKLIGYTPRSYASAKAQINVTVTPRNTLLNEYVFPVGSTFSSNITDLSKSQTYKFTNLNDIVCTKNSSGNLVANNVDIYQGTFIKKRIQINSTQSNNEYIIDDKNIDTSTLKVAVYQTGRSEINEVYSLFTDINIVDDTTPIYFLYENYNGNYVISFGNGLFGKKPDNLNVLELTYLVTDGIGANSSNIFSYSDFFDSTQLTRVSLNTVASAVGGSDRESISSIKYNAPLQYVSQNRAVTADDYKTLVHSYLTNVKSVAVWGGEDNDPPQYGKVFISAKKSDSSSVLTSNEKQGLLTYLSDKKVLSIFPEIVDPEYVDIVLDVLFKYNRNLTTYTKTQLETKVKESIGAFNSQYLESFDGVFRHSFLSKTVDGTSPAILNSLIRVFISKSFTLVSGQPQKITIKFGTSLTVDDNIAIVNSTGWVYDGVTYYIGEEAHPTLSDIRLLYVYYYDVNDKPIIRNKDVGTLTLSTGVMEIEPLLADTDTTMIIDVIPLSNDLAPKRNQLMRIDTTRLNVYGEVDLIAVGGSNRSVQYNTFSRDR